LAKQRVHLRIKGRVQGVFFRYETQSVAQSLGLVGWVRNRLDGSVEVVAEGEKEKLEELVKWCHNGPPLARVDSVEVQWEEPTGEFKNFSIERTV